MPPKKLPTPQFIATKELEDLEEEFEVKHHGGAAKELETGPKNKEALELGGLHPILRQTDLEKARAHKARILREELKRIDQKRKRKGRHIYTVPELLAYQKDEYLERASRITAEDVRRANKSRGDMSTTSSSESGDEPRDRWKKHRVIEWCGNINQYEVGLGFDDKEFRARFMSNALFLMAASEVPAIIINTFVTCIPFLRHRLFGTCTLLGIIAIVPFIWMNIYIRCMTKGSGLMVRCVFGARAICYALVIAGLTEQTEIAVIEYAFGEPFKHIVDPAQELFIAENTDPRLPTTTTIKPKTTTIIIDKALHTAPILWLIILYNIFFTWLISAIVLRKGNLRKMDPNGPWMFIIGFSLAVATLCITYTCLILLKFGYGPSQWDLAQVFISTIVTGVEAVWLPISWRRLFEGRSCSINEKDVVNIAARYSI